MARLMYYVWISRSNGGSVAWRDDGEVSQVRFSINLYSGHYESWSYCKVYANKYNVMVF